MNRKARKLVIQHLENISRKALEDYQRNIQDYIKGKQGVYALYRGDRLKYVGLATDLRNRLKTHLKDRHALNWDKFSVYLTAGDEHLRELEALVLRIAAPKENRNKTKLNASENLRKRFKRDVALWQKKERNELLGSEEFEEEASESSGESRAPRRNWSEESARVGKGFRLRADYKDTHYIAKVRANGKISLDGKLYANPSCAAEAITHHPTSGWRFWKFRNEKGQWVWIDELRKR